MKTAAAAALALAVGLASTACDSASTPRQSLTLAIPRLDGAAVMLEIVDETQELIDARALTGNDLELAAHDLRDRRIGAVGGATPNQVRVAWVGTPCDTSGVLTIAYPNRITVAPGSIAACDDIVHRRAVVLTFRGPVNAPSFVLELKPTVRVEGPIPGEGVGG